MKKHTLRFTLAAASALSVSIASQLHAAPFVSNGAGGGVWEDPASWLGGVGFPNTFVGDSATITAGDVIIYDDSDAEYVIDQNGGVTTPATPFTAAMGVTPGGLSVANGNSITIDTGGILTQANLPHEIRIGEGAGGVSGLGTMTIDTGGIFSSGTAVGVAVGSDINNTGLGNGTVNLKDGQFIMGGFLGAGVIPAGPAALGVGIEGSTGTFNVGDGIGAAGSATLDLEGNGNNLGIGTTNQLGSAAGMGTVIVNADGLLSFSSGSIVLGEVGGFGTLTVNGGTVGNGAIATGEIRVGAGGMGVFNINSGTVNTAGQLNIGRGAGASGVATLTTGTLITGQTRVGRESGTGDLNILGGTMTTTFLGVADNGMGTVDVTGGTVAIGNAGQSYVGNGAGAVGTLNIAGPGVVNNTGVQDWQIGFNGGTGNVNVTGGGKLNHNWWFNIARGSTSTGTVNVDGPGSEIKLSGGGDIHMNVGEDGTGEMNVTNGGVVTHNDNNAYRTFIGRNAGSNGTLNVNTGGRFDTTEVFVANGGATAEMNITNGGIVTAQNWMSVGQGGGSVGTVNIDGAGSLLDTRSPILGRNGGNGGDINIGQSGGNGTVNVTDGGSWRNGWWLFIARDAGSTGVVNVDGAGSNLVVGDPSGLGPDARLLVGQGGTGTLNIINGGSVKGSTETWVGHSSGSNGRMNVNTGGSFETGNWVMIGNERGSTGRVDLDDAASSIHLTGAYDAGGNLGERSRFFVGRSGTGTLNQTAGTITFGGWSAIGLDRGSTGTYNMSGGLLQTRPEFDFDWYVGRQNHDPADLSVLPARGALNVSGTADFNMQTDVNNGDPGGRNGMRLNVGTGHDFGTNTSSGTVNITGGTLSVLSFTVGDNGKATVVQDAGTVNVGQWLEIGQGNAADNPGDPLIDPLDPTYPFTRGNGAIYTLNGGTINAQQIVVGSRRAGTMVVNGGTINLGNNGTIQVANWGDFAVGRDGGGADHGDGQLFVNGGTINGNGKHLQLARGGPNTKGVLTMTGGDINGLSLMTLGEGGATTAIANLSGGTITTNNEVRVGQGRGTVGTLNMSGTAVLTSGGEFQVGNDGGTGVANIDGGTVNALSYVAIGRSIGAFQISNFATADAVIDGGPELAYSFAANYTTSNTFDNGDGGNFGGGIQVQGMPAGDNNDFAFVALANFTVNTTGSYIFGNNTDDGSRLRLSINGGAYTEIITDNVLSGPHDAFSAPIALTLGDTIALDWMWFERGGGAEGESFYSRDAGPNALWEDATQGLTLSGGQYAGTVYKAVAFGSTGTVNLSGTGVIQKTGGGGTFDIGSWNGGGGAVTPVTGTLNQSGGSVINTVSDTHIGRDTGVVGLWDISDGTATLARLNVGNDGTGTLTMTGGRIEATSVYVGANGPSTGTANLDGGVLATQFIEAGGGTASLAFDGGTLEAIGDESNFIRNFDDGATHSAIEIEDGDATIDDGGFIVRITASNVIANPGDTTIDGLAGTVLNKDGTGTLTIEGAAGDGNLTVRALDGDLDFESSQNLDALVIASGATVTLSAPSTPPAPAELVAGGPEDLAGDDSGVVAAAGDVHAVPEPGTLGLLTIGLLGLLARRIRGKRG